MATRCLLRQDSCAQGVGPEGPRESPGAAWASPRRIPGQTAVGLEASRLCFGSSTAWASDGSRQEFMTKSNCGPASNARIDLQAQP